MLDVDIILEISNYFDNTNDLASYYEYILKYTALDNIPGLNYKYKNISIKNICKKGYIELLKCLYHKISENQQNKCINWISSGGHLDMLIWINKQNAYCTTDAMNNAAKNGHLHIVKWLNENRDEGCTHLALDWAAEKGYLDILKYLFQNTYESLKYGIFKAARNGHFNILKWVYQNEPGFFQEEIINYLALGGHLDIIKWFYKKINEVYFINALKYAASQGHLDIVKWIHNNNRRKDYGIEPMTLAAKNGHITVIKWLHENTNRDYGTSPMYYAAKNGHLEILKWLHENRQEKYTKSVMYSASKSGYLHIVKFIYNNIDQDSVYSAIYNAVKHGKIEIVEFLYNKVDNEIKKQCINLAIENGHLDIVKLLYEDTLEYLLTSNIIEIAISNNHLEILKFLYDNGILNHNICKIDKAVINGNTELVKFVYEKGFRVHGSYIMDYAALNGHFEILKIINENRHHNFGNVYGYRNGNIMNCAAKSGNLHIVKYIYYEKIDYITTWALYSAATYGYTDIFKFLYSKSHDSFNYEIINTVIRNGHLNILKLIYGFEKYELKKYWMVYAIENRQYHIVKWFIEQNIEYDPDYINIAAEYGDISIFKLLYKRTYDIRNIVNIAVYNGNLNIIKWLCKEKIIHDNIDIPCFITLKSKLNIVRFFNHYKKDMRKIIQECINFHKWSILKWWIRNCNHKDIANILCMNLFNIYDLKTFRWIYIKIFDKQYIDQQKDTTLDHITNFLKDKADKNIFEIYLKYREQFNINRIKNIC